MATLRRLGRAGLLSLSTVLSAVLFAGCGAYGDSPAAVSEPAGSSAEKIWDLFVPIFWLSVIVFVVVSGLLLFFLVRFRRRPNQPNPPALHGNTRLEIAWTIAPALILAVIAVPTITTIFDLAEDPGEEAVTVRVTGQQWWWSFEYPDAGFVTANEFHIPVGQPVRLELTSADVIHSFWAPQLAGKQDAVPGKTIVLAFTPQEAGTFYGQCAEFCGLQHAHMGFRVVVEESQESYQAWVQRMQGPGAEPAGGSQAAQGRDLFMSQACIGCHTVQGTQARGVTGPNLTHLMDRQIIAGGVMENTPENLAEWIANPQDVKPGNKMPDLGLSDDQVAAIAAYLSTLE